MTSSRQDTSTCRTWGGLETFCIVNAGTCSSLRLRGYTKPCYNIVEVEGDEVKIYRKFPFGGQTVLAHFSLSTGAQYHRQLEALVQEPRRNVALASE